jgi:hypothetical protein
MKFQSPPWNPHVLWAAVLFPGPSYRRTKTLFIPKDQDAQPRVDRTARLCTKATKLRHFRVEQTFQLGHLKRNICSKSYMFSWSFRETSYNIEWNCSVMFTKP